MTIAQPDVCGARGYLPHDLLSVALSFERTPGSAELRDAQRHLRCTLEPHPGSAHYGIVMELQDADTGSVWAHWPDRQFPRELGVLQDCTHTGPDDAPCVLFEDHPGHCSWALHDPLEDVAVRMTTAILPPLP